MKKRYREQKHPLIQKLMEYGLVIVGSAIIAIGFNVFLLPNQVASGGVSGISTILDSTLGWEPAYVLWGSISLCSLRGLLSLEDISEPKPDWNLVSAFGGISDKGLGGMDE